MLNKNHFLVFIGINTERMIMTKNAKKKKQSKNQEHKINSPVCLSPNRIKRKLEIESEA